MHLHTLCFSPSVEPVGNDGMEDLTEDMEFDNSNQDDSAYESHFLCGKLSICNLRYIITGIVSVHNVIIW